MEIRALRLIESKVFLAEKNKIFVILVNFF